MITDSDVVQMKITPEDTAEADRERQKGYSRRLVQHLVQTNDDREEGRRDGFLGQVLAARYFGVDGFASSDVDHDVTLRKKFIDVKTKRTPTTSFNLAWRGVVRADLVDLQKCDGYLFLMVNPPESVAWLMGWATKEQFRQKAKFQKQGEPFDDSGGYSVRADCYAIPYRELDPVSELIDLNASLDLFWSGSSR
jgi:hypothetical protein